MKEQINETGKADYSLESGNYSSEFLQRNIRNETQFGIYKIRLEKHPLRDDSFVYRAYHEDMTPFYVGREKLGELIDYMYQMHPELKFSVEGLNERILL